jgi:septal ring factor EnvC (AmiA/AmiB activator)
VGTGSALVPLDVGKRATGVLDVDERRVLRRPVDWLDPLADDAVKAYLADGRAEAAVVTQLRQAWDARAKLRVTLDDLDKLTAERNQLTAQIDQLNTSLRAIEKNRLADQLRKELTDRLSKASARIDEITKRVIVLEMQRNEQTIRFRDLITPIKMLKPLPVP